MSNRLSRYLIAAVAALGLAGPLHAQGRSAVSGAELDAAVVTRRSGNREAVLQFLATDQVSRLAGRLGASAPELSAKVSILDDASLQLMVQRTGIAERPLAGGTETVVISTTVIIIALLIIILLVK